MDLVFEGAEGSMQEAVEKVRSLPGYEETGEVKTHVHVCMKYTSTCIYMCYSFCHSVGDHGCES